MVNRKEGVKVLLEIALKNLSENNGFPFKPSKQTTKVCEELSTALTSVYDSGTVTDSSGSSTVLTHGKGYVPIFNIISNAYCYCSAVDEQTITISYVTAITFQVLCY